MSSAIITATEFPAHIFEYDGRLVNAEVSEQNIAVLREQARKENINIEAECVTRYGVKTDWLTYDQWKEISSEILFNRAARFAAQPKHFHRCDNCGDARLHLDKYCEGRHPAGDITEECRACDDRSTVFYRRSGL